MITICSFMFSVVLSYVISNAFIFHPDYVIYIWRNIFFTNVYLRVKKTIHKQFVDCIITRLITLMVSLFINNKSFCSNFR